MSFVVVAVGGALFGLAHRLGRLEARRPPATTRRSRSSSASCPVRRLPPGRAASASPACSRSSRPACSSGIGRRASCSSEARVLGASAVADADLRRERARVPARRPPAPDGARGSRRAIQRRPTLRPGAAVVCLTVIARAPGVGLPGDVPAALARSRPRATRPVSATAASCSSSAGAACAGQSRWPPHWPCRCVTATGEPFPERGLVIFLASP